MMEKFSNIRVVAKQASPLCILPCGHLVYYKYGIIYIWNGEIILKEIKVINTFKERWIGRMKPLFRLLRLGIRAAIALNDDIILLSVGNYIYELDLLSGILSNGYFCGTGIRPLIFTKIKDITTFEDGIYFGGYLNNKDKNPVAVYRRISQDDWMPIFTFPSGEINHVHCIVADKFRSCVWIYTGDFDNASAIWQVNNGFKDVKRFLSGKQIYRGCVVFPLPEGLLYATDTPFADNYIFLLDPQTKELKKLYSIDGSCIYGCKWQDKYVFSSTVEGDGRNTSKMEFYFGRKNGVGIKNNRIHLYIGNTNIGFEEVFQLKKDLFPYYTFQFGVFKFPYGYNSTDTLYFQPISTKKYDLCLMELTSYNDNKKNNNIRCQYLKTKLY